MQKKSCFILLPFWVILISFNLTFGQGIIINEVSQGVDGTKEFIELLVVGSNALTTASIDLTGWIVDDNNGEFDANDNTVGTQRGYLILGACLNNVHPGDLIVIYNNNDKNTNMPADDDDDTNPSNNVYVFSHIDPCLSQCSSNPEAGVTSSYIPCTGGVSNPVTAWRASLRNLGDAVQTRRPDGTFFSGLAYGDVDATATRPTFPSGTNSFGIPSLNTSNEFAALGCGNGAWESSVNYSVGTATSDTPGAVNNAANTVLINEIRAGGFDYTNLSNPDNCDGIILPIELISFIGNRKYTNVILNWTTTSETDNDHFDIEKSSNGNSFEKIGTIKGKGTTNSIQKYTFTYPNESYQTEYYRLKQVDFDATSTYSPIIAISPMQNGSLSLETFPQPFQDVLKLNLSNSKEGYIDISIYNTLGQVIYHQKEFYQKSKGEFNIKTQNWNSGTYFVQIKNQTKVITKKIFKLL
jgi:hypothetical protein